MKEHGQHGNAVLYLCSCTCTLICNYWTSKLFSAETARSQRAPGRVGACLTVLIPSGNGSTTMRQHRHWNMSSFTVCFNFNHMKWEPVYCTGVRKWALAEAEVRFNENNCLEYVQQCMMCFNSFLLEANHSPLSPAIPTHPLIHFRVLYYDNYYSVFSLNLILVLCTSLSSKHFFTDLCQKSQGSLPYFAMFEAIPLYYLLR